MIAAVFYEVGHEDEPLYEMFLPCFPPHSLRVRIRDRVWLVNGAELLADKNILVVWVVPGW